MKLHLPSGTFEEKVIEPLDTLIKEDPRYKKQLLYAYLSTNCDPYNLGCLGPSSEGKTYPAVATGSVFPQENIWYLGGMSPTSLIHDHAVLIDSNGHVIEETVNGLSDKIEELEAKLTDAKNKQDLKEEIIRLKQERKELQNNSKYLIDLTGKVLLFLEPPHYETWARLKPILSHDKYEIEFRITEKSKRGQLYTNHIIIRGWPVSIFCSAREESDKWSMWEEIQTRHEIVSPAMTLQKYLAANKFSAIKKGLPQSVADKKIDKQRLQEAQEYMQSIINRIKDIQFAVQSETKEAYPNLTWIPFANLLADAYPHDSGIRMREYYRLLSKLNVIGFAHMAERSFVRIDGLPYLITSFFDLNEALDITPLTTDLPPFKIRFYYDIFMPAVEQKYISLQPLIKNKQGTLGSGDDAVALELSEEDKKRMPGVSVTAKEVEEFMHDKLNKKLSAKKIRDRYLGPLEEHGLLSVEKDKENERRNAYFPEIVNGHFKPQAINIDDIVQKFTLDYLREQYYELTLDSKSIVIEYNESKLELEELYTMITKLPENKGVNEGA